MRAPAVRNRCCTATPSGAVGHPKGHPCEGCNVAADAATVVAAAATGLDRATTVVVAAGYRWSPVSPPSLLLLAG